jgi:hypothetical protein
MGGSLKQMMQEIGCAGGAAVTTVSFIHPIDVVKTRLQVNGGTIGSVISTTMAKEGAGAFYNGITAAWLREASYTSLRLGLYAPIKEITGASDPNCTFKFGRQFLAGVLAGAVGSSVGNPFDVLKTRLMASKEATSMGKEASELYKSQGVGGFYRGFSANVSRAMVLNGTKMSCYDQVKAAVVSAGVGGPKDLLTSAVSAFCAGFFMTCTVAPFDLVRTKLMNQAPGVKEYTGMIDCAVKVMAADGPGGFYRGFIPIWGRFAPTTTLQLIFFEQFKRLLIEEKEEK